MFSSKDLLMQFTYFLLLSLLTAIAQRTHKMLYCMVQKWGYQKVVAVEMDFWRRGDRQEYQEKTKP
jgi:hypothetical protein